jgi:hypothetical protein
MKICKECNEEVTTKSFEDEIIDWCESCQQLEPDTIEEDDMIDDEEWEDDNDETLLEELKQLESDYPSPDSDSEDLV